MDNFKSNKNIKKRIAEGFAWVIITILFIPFVLSLLSSQPLFQTFSARLVTKILSDHTGYNIKINSIDLRFLKGINAGGLTVYDKKGNIMIKVGTLEAVPVYADRKLFGIMFHKINLDSVDLRIGSYTENDTLNLIKFVNSFSSDTTKSNSGSVFKLKINNLKLTNTHFEIFNKYDTSGNGKAMDYSNMNFSNVNIDINNFKLIDDSLNFKINGFSADEKSGLKVKNLSTNFILSGTTISGKDLKGELNNSKLDCDISLKYKTWGSMSYFTDSVQLYGNFRNTKLNLSDIGNFVDGLDAMKDEIKIKGIIKGTVNDLNCKNLTVSYGKNTLFQGNIKIKDLAEFDSTYYNAQIDKLTMSLQDLKNFRLPDGTTIPVDTSFNLSDIFTVSGKFEGNYLDFNSDITITNGKSNISSAITLYNKDTLSIKANVKGHINNAGNIIKRDDLIGNSDLQLELKGNGKSFEHYKLNSKVILLNTGILGYTYDSIKFTGTVTDNYFIAGKLDITDKNLNLKSKLSLKLKDNNNYKIRAFIKKADLKRLKLSNSVFSFKTKAEINLSGTNLDNITGYVKFDGIHLVLNGYNYNFKHIFFNSKDSVSNKTYILKSDFINAYASGKFKPSSLYDNALNLLNSYLFFTDKKQKKDTHTENIFVTLDIKNDKLLSEQLIKNVRISPYSSFKAYMDFSRDSLNVEAASNLVKSGDIKLKNNNFKIFTEKNKLFLDLKSGFLILKDSSKTDTTVIGMENMNILASSTKEMTDFKITWDNTYDTTTKNYGKIKGYLFKKKTSKELSFDDAYFYAFDTLWTINKNNLIVFDTGGIYFHNFIIKGGRSTLSVKGKIPEKDKDSLSVSFKNWNLSNFNPLIKSSGYNLGGFLNGSVETMIYDTNFTFTSNLKVKNFALNNVKLGDLHLLNTWDNIDKSIFVKSQIIKKGNVGVGEIFSLEGFIYPFKNDSSLFLNSSFSRLNISFLNPVLSDLFHNIKGKAKGNLHLTGSFDKPILTGRVNLFRTSMVVNYLNTKYSFTNYLNFEKNKINFNDLIIYDTLGNHAEINGNITHNYFSDFGFNFKISTEKLLFVNTTKRLNDLYYGTVMASGKVHMWGDPEKLNLKIDTKTAKGTDLSIPLDQAYSISNDFITFVPPPIDSSDLITEAEADFEKEIEEEEMKYDIDIDAKITPDAKVNIYLPSDLGKIESKGHGNISLKASSKGEFTMFGDYIVDNGNFNFNFKNLISKRFSLVPGGKITWTGDPENAYLNIKGLYKVKVNLSSLGIVVDSTSDFKNKQTVNCYIILKNKLLNPDVRFSIELPEADPDIRRMVYANLDTTNPAMVNEQMISLLVFGSFSFNNANNFSMASQGYNILSNQLSSMLSRISNNFDIGMNYKPGDEITQQEFEVALSTQLFNDRLIINGNVGMTYDRSQKSASNIIGDVDIMYKLTKDGRWLLKAFNHSNANSWYYYNNYDKISPYTQGVGIAYRKEFDNISELFRPKRKKNKKENTEK